MNGTPRSYGQYCGVARALDLVGDRWALLVVRELVLGPGRFTDLMAGLPGVSTNVLSSRLRELEASGVVARRTFPPPTPATVYELTEHGRALEPALLALGRWGARSLGKRGNETLRSDWLALALRAFFHSPEAGAQEAVYEVRLPEGAFRVAVAAGAVDVSRGGADEADLVLETDDDGLVWLLAGAHRPSELLASGAVRIVAGDEAGLDGFVERFRFSEPVEA